MTCFWNLPIVLYYEIVRLGFDYNRIDITFDRYLMIAWKKAEEKAEALEKYLFLMILILHSIWLAILLEIARIKTI